MTDRRSSKREATRPAPAPFTLTTGWAAAILALLVVLFFHEVVVGGKTFVSPDATAPAGFVHVGEQSLYKDHVYPLWNPYVFLGMPSFASGTYNPLIYPPDWPLALLQKVLPLPELTWMLLYYALAGLFTFLLAREWGARPEGALLGAVAFVFAPNLIAVGSHGHGSQLVDSAYLPLMLWLAARWLRGGSLADLAWLALAGGFQILRGHVQICFYTWIAVGLYAAVVWIAAVRRPGALAAVTLRVAGVLGAAVLAFGVAGFYNLPLRDYASFSIRGSAAGGGGGVGMDYATQWSLSPRELPTLIVPGWTGFGGQTYWGSMPFTDYPNAYVGLVTLLLAVPAVFGRGVPRAFALVLGVVALMISFGNHFPLYGLLYDHLPLFNKFRVPVMVIVLFQIAAALGLAWGWSSVLERAAAKGDDAKAFDRLLLGAGAVLLGALVLGVLAQDAWRGAYVAAATADRRGGQPFPPELAALAYRGFVGDLGRGCLLGLAAVALALLARRAKLTPTVATLGVLALLAIELWPVSGRVMLPVVGDPVERNADLGRDDVIDFLEKSGPAGNFRILPLQEYQSNRFAGFAIASLGGYHAAKPRLYQDFFEAGLPNDPTWLRLLNVRYLVTRQPIEPAPPGLTPVFSGSGYVYENAGALPRVTLVDQYRVVQPAKAILDSVAREPEGVEHRTFLESDPHLTLGPVAGGQARVVSYRLNDVAIDVDTPGPALVRVADLWHPDWTARVDGQKAPVLKADYLLRAVPVAAGKHRVELVFEPAAMRQGLQLSIGSLVVVLLLFAVALVRRRGGRVAAAPGTEH